MTEAAYKLSLALLGLFFGSQLPQVVWLYLKSTQESHLFVPTVYKVKSVVLLLASIACSMIKKKTDIQRGNCRWSVV